MKHLGETFSTLSSEKVECRVNLGSDCTTGEGEGRERLKDDLRFSSLLTSVQICESVIFICALDYI